MKKFSVFLALIILLSVFSACGGQEQPTDDPVVAACLSVAQGYLDNGDIDSAVKVLEEGLGMTDSPEIAKALENAKQQKAALEATEGTAQATEPEATVAQTEATEPAEDVDLLAENQRKINLFLSNFAETYFEEYPCSEYDMLMFGFIHSKINSSKTLKYDDYVEYINKKDMDTVLKDYFDKTIKPDEEGELFYDDEDMDWYVTFDGSRYEIDAADGECYDYIAVAKSMVDNGDGTYKVEFDVYYAEDGVKSSYYDYTLAQAAKSSKLERTDRGTAIVKEHTRSNGKESYALIKYTLK